jgi:uncharacterized membrane protein
MKQAITSSFVAGAIALAIAGASTSARAEVDAEKEKCYGVAKAGQNGCASADKSHTCAAHGTVDGSGQEWIALPKGVCEKIVGGMIAPFEGVGAKHECSAKQSCSAKQACNAKQSCSAKDDKKG